MIPRGMHDIRTHNSLAREGRLISVARDLHRSNNIKDTPRSSDWDAKQHIFKKTKPATVANVDPFRRDPCLERKVRLHQIEVAQSLLAEFQQAATEGLPVSLREVERLKTKLTELQTE